MADAEADRLSAYGSSDQRPLGQGVGGEDDHGVGRQRLERVAPDGPALVVDERRQVEPVVDARRSRGPSDAAGPVVVLADARRREVRREHDADDPIDPGPVELGNTVLDVGRRVLGAARHDEATGLDRVQRRGDRAALGPGPFGQR